MKKLWIYIFIILCCPILSFGKVTCSSGNYTATINIENNKIKFGEIENILIESNINYNIEYKFEKEDIIMINENKIYPIKSGQEKITAIISFLEEENIVSTCTSFLDVSVLSNDSSLKSLNLEELDISYLFDKEKYEYKINLPYRYDKINILAESNDINATITGDGRRYLNEGINEYEIIVKATDGTTTTYKLIINRENASDDNKLEILNVEGYVISPKFDKDIFEYSLNVDNYVDNITINATPTYELAKIIGTGNYKLATGENKFYITVIAENNTEQKYLINVNKNKGNSILTNLEINNYKLDKEFKSDIYTYKISVNNDIEKLEIIAETNENDQIEIIGNENLVVGENNIIIRVSNEDKGATTYKLIVNKLSIDEQKSIEKNDMLLKNLLILFIISIFIMAISIFVFIKKNYKTQKK